MGIVPSLLAIVVPATPRAGSLECAAAEGKAKKGGLGRTIADRRWRRNAIGGLLLAAAGVVASGALAFSATTLLSSLSAIVMTRPKCGQ